MIKQPVIVATWEFAREPVRKCAELLTQGTPPLDALEQAIWIAEDDPDVMSVGYGGLPNEAGFVELDAAIMDGPRHLVGAVGALQEIRHPISVARKVMEATRHALLTGEAATAFAEKHGFQRENLLTDKTRARYDEWKKKGKDSFRLQAGRPGAGTPAPRLEESHDTICILLLDSRSNLYAAGSTSGLAWKMPGRISDTAIAGAGFYVDNDIGAAAATGHGELAIRHSASFAVVELMRTGYDPQEACEIVLERIRKKEELSEPQYVAMIALRKDGKFAGASLKRHFPIAIIHGGDTQLVEGNII